MNNRIALRTWYLAWFAFGAILFLDSPKATGQDSNTRITGGLAIYENGTSISTREINLRPHAENALVSNRLVPAASELIEGEGAAIFLRMNFEASGRLAAVRQIQQKEYDEKRLEDLDANEILNLQAIPRSEMRRFVYRSRAGWNYPLREEPWMEILLPDVQESRSYARAMTAYARASILRNELSDAEEWIRLTMGLARHVSETPFVVTRLVACAQTNMALDTLEELVQHPKADNYYWDLVAIPRPFVNARETAQFEAAMWERSIPSLQNLDRISTEEEWMDLVQKTMEAVSLNSDDFPKWGTPEADQEWNRWVTQSRERLHRVAPELFSKMKSMSDAEVGMRYWWLRVQQGTKLHVSAGLEPHLAIPRAQESLKEFWSSFEDELPVRSSFGFYSPTQLLYFHTIDQRIAMLRIVESIRDWSASHAGRLPSSLDQLDLPVPPDVLNNQPFEWSLSEDGNTGLLAGSILELPQPNSDKPQLRGTRYRIVRVSE